LIIFSCIFIFIPLILTLFVLDDGDVIISCNLLISCRLSST
jgi:hypothetical protein